MQAEDIAINLVTSGVMLIVAILFVLIWKKQTNGMFSWVGMGCLAWVVSVAAKAAIAVVANEPIFIMLKNTLGNTGYVILGSLWLGLLTGFTEITFGFWIAKNRKYDTYKQGSGYGLGFGVTEASLIAISFAILVLIEVYAPGNLPSEILKMIIDISWDNVAIVNIERVLATVIHIATGILIVYSLAAKKTAYFWMAFAYKSTVDGVAGAGHLTGVIDKWNPWLIEAFVLPFAILGVIIILVVRKKWSYSVSKNNGL